MPDDGNCHADWAEAGVQASRRRWDYQFRRSSGFSSAPNRLLSDVVEHEVPGDALDVGIGQGRNALYLASRGWRVTGIDFSAEGLELTRLAAEVQGVAIQLINADVDHYELSSAAWDLVAFLYMGDSVALVRRLLEALRPNGLFVCECFHIDSEFSARAGGWETGALARLVGGDFEVLRDELSIDSVDWASGRETAVIRFVARRRVPR